MKRAYEGDPLDHTWQYFHERPAANDGDDADEETAEDGDAGETVYAADPEPAGTETAKNVPAPGTDPAEASEQVEEASSGAQPVRVADGGESPEPPEATGQTTLGDWGWS